MSLKESSGCVLDDKSCVTLDKILKSFGAPISEEQAWALSYALAECYTDLSDKNIKNLVLVTSLKHVVLHKDGQVDPQTFLPTAQDQKRLRAPSESRLVYELGVVLYRALDFTLGNEEERDLSPSLHKLIDLMTSSESERGETDDEGIEKDSGESEDERESPDCFTVRDVFQMCQDRLSDEGVESSGLDDHYRAVVRAYITEAVDLRSFLQKVAEGARFVATQSDLLSSEQDLHQLQCEDWARLWKQVMRGLRNGVKLKKVEYTKTPLEYALTPYEMLMEDIRARRFTLNKVMVNGDIAPRVKKDAHTIILDFIRSRPPLRKASDRQLRPRTNMASPMELLMESIRKNDLRLNHVVTPVRSRPTSLVVESSSQQPCSNGIAPHQPRRKLIAAPRLNLNTEDEEDDLSDIPPSSPRLSANGFCGALSTATRTHASLNTTPTSSPSSPPQLQSPLSRVAYDLVNYGGSNMNGSQHGRRHSISICETPAGGSRGGSPQHAPGTPCNESATCNSFPSAFCCTSKIQQDFLTSAHFASRLDCLSLTLEEVVHIRNVLTKADLEALPLDLSLKEDVAKGKICFLCMKTRFGFFAPKGRDCRLCRRIVCKKCCTQMRIPTEHFSNIPVIMLTPQALSPREDDESSTTSLPRTFLNMLQDFPRPGQERRRSSASGSVGSAPSSPSSTPKSGKNGTTGPTSLPAPCVTQDIKKKQEMRQRNHEIEERLRGELMAVCLDCKAMVIHVLLSIKRRKDQQQQQQQNIHPPSSHIHKTSPSPHDPSTTDAIRGNLHLNLQSVYN